MDSLYKVNGEVTELDVITKEQLYIQKELLGNLAK